MLRPRRLQLLSCCRAAVADLDTGRCSTTAAGQLVARSGRRWSAFGLPRPVPVAHCRRAVSVDSGWPEWARRFSASDGMRWMVSPSGRETSHTSSLLLTELSISRYLQLRLLRLFCSICIDYRFAITSTWMHLTL